MDDNDRKLIRTLGVLSTVGMTMVFSTIIGLYVGYKLDQWLGTGPWLMAVFLFLGIAAGFKNLFVYVKKSGETFKEDSKDEK